MKKYNLNSKRIKEGLSKLFWRLKKLPKVFNKKEKVLFFVFTFCFFVSLISLIVSLRWQRTTIVPADGGILREGVAGQPRFINPIYAASNDVDRDLVNLIYSGLFKYDSAGQIIPDLAENYTIEEDGKVYNVFLKKNVLFHDRIGLKADDVLFTIKTIQNPDFKSPLQAQWLDVKTEKISDYQIKFTLKNPYPGFIETLTLKILPAHIWQDIPSQSFPLSNYNFKPIGSGPYFLKNISQEKSGEITLITLEKFYSYHSALPHVNQIYFLFFKDQNELLKAAQNNIIDSFAPLLSENYKTTYSFNDYSFIIPRYFALFFNTQNDETLADKDVRLAINYATNKQEIRDTVLAGKGKVVFSPFLLDIYQPTASSTLPIDFNLEKAEELFKNAGFTKQDGQLVKNKAAQTMTFTSDIEPGSQGKTIENLQKCLAGLEGIYPGGEISGYFGAKTKEAVIRFQEKYADEILKPAGLSSGNGRIGPGTRKKLNELCVVSPQETIAFKITITTTQDPMLLQTAKLLEEQWQQAGIKTEIQSLPISTIKQEVIKERKYQALLFGQVLGLIPDPFPFWHSSQRSYPGLNLAEYRNKKVDKLLEEARVEPRPEVRYQKYQEAEGYLLEDAPAIFLYNPNFVYSISDKIKGVKAHLIADPSQRFAGVGDWYIHTKRVRDVKE